MFQWLVGFCRNTPFFDPKSKKKLTARTNEIEELFEQSTPEAKVLAGKKINALYKLAIGDESEEPLFELLAPELMDELDQVYCKLFRSDVKSGDIGPWELIFSDKLPPGFTSDDIRVKNDQYFNDVVKVLNDRFQKSRDDRSIPEEHRRLLAQMSSKVNILTGYNGMGCATMPPMPILTRSVVQMLVRRFEGVSDAIYEVSPF